MTRTKDGANAGQESYQKECHPGQRILAKSVVTLYITTRKNESRAIIRSDTARRQGKDPIAFLVALLTQPQDNARMALFAGDG